MTLNISNSIDCDLISDESLSEFDVELKLARFDLVHPYISGNKLYKLYFFLEDARKNGCDEIVTFGGAYSNHLIATSAACKESGLKCMGIVRGEESSTLSPVLKLCMEHGMQLKFISRQNYAEEKLNVGSKGNQYFIPEGGYHPIGAKGASLMLDAIATQSFTHLITAVGTATTLAGLLRSDAKVIAVPVIKNMTDVPERLGYLLGKQPSYTIWNEYHFNGYAKFTPQLLSFMDEFKSLHNIELDKVYTAKMMFGVIDKIKLGYFPKGSRILCLHTGGLTGNFIPE